MKNIKYSFEYFCSPIWVEETNLENPIFKNMETQELAINNYLKSELLELDNIYQSKFNDNYPPEPFGFDVIENIIFSNRVIISAELLKINLGPEFNLIFDLDYWKNRVLKLKANFH